MMYNISGLRHRFSNELLGGGGTTYLYNSLAMTNQEGQFEVSRRVLFFVRTGVARIP